MAVYRALLKTYKPVDIGHVRTSAGAILTGEVAVRLRQLGLPLPGALGIFSGMGDFSQNGDSQALSRCMASPGTSIHRSRRYRARTRIRRRPTA